MSETGSPATPEAILAALRTRGADRFDPVRFRFIEALARRAAARPAAVKRQLDDKLAGLLADYGARFEQAHQEAGPHQTPTNEPVPAADDALRQIPAADDLGSPRRPIAHPALPGDTGPLAELLAHIRQHEPSLAPGGPTPVPPAALTPQSELKALSYFRKTWSQLSVDQQLADALAQAPDNAGPLNSQRLALEALKLMRDTSPDYLKRFMSYVDALFWLDQTDVVRAPGQKNAAEGDRKRKTSRRSSG